MKLTSQQVSLKEEILEKIKNVENANSNVFTILKDITLFYNQYKDYNNDIIVRETRDFLCRVLEKQDSFSDMQPIISDLLREVGYYQYVPQFKLESFSTKDLLEIEIHRPQPYDEENVIFHREQFLIYQKIMNGENLVLSAPTSFGKSKIIDAVVSSEKFNNILLIVPTIALIDETRRRLSRFSNKYKILHNISQAPGKRNIFILTAERANVYDKFPQIDFFVIDEFYKISNFDQDPERTTALNQAFYKFKKHKSQFYLIGPTIKTISDDVRLKIDAEFILSNFTTVATDVFRVNYNSQIEELTKLLNNNLYSQSTIIYCKSSNSANVVGNQIIDHVDFSPSDIILSAVEWLKEHYSHDWIVCRALAKGVGIHHGKLPRSISSFIVNQFNQKNLRILICTSTLIEGVNSVAENVIIYDKKIANSDFDLFTYNNIKGRSGRMFKHFVGKVFLFHDPPQDDLLQVDFPIISQLETIPSSMIVHLDESDMKQHSKLRLDSLKYELPIPLLKKHFTFEPENLIALSNHIENLNPEESRNLFWSGEPDYNNILEVSKLYFMFLKGKQNNQTITSDRQLAFKINRLRYSHDIKHRINQEMMEGKEEFRAAAVDDALERILDFDRNWVSFKLPTAFIAISDIVNFSLQEDACNYSYFANRLENLFLPAYHYALEEIGIPTQITSKFSNLLSNCDSIDSVFERLKGLNLKDLNLSLFEREVLKSSIESI